MFDVESGQSMLPTMDPSEMAGTLIIRALSLLQRPRLLRRKIDATLIADFSDREDTIKVVNVGGSFKRLTPGVLIESVAIIAGQLGFDLLDEPRFDSSEVVEHFAGSGILYIAEEKSFDSRRFPYLSLVFKSWYYASRGNLVREDLIARRRF